MFSLTLLSSGIVKFQHLVDKVKRKLLATGIDVSKVDEAVEKLKGKLDEEVGRVGISEGDYVSLDIEYNVEDNTVIWNFESLKLKVYRPIDEVESKFKEEVEKLRSKVKELENEVSKLKEENSKLMEALNKVKEVVLEVTK